MNSTGMYPCSLLSFRSDSLGDHFGRANLSVEEPDALMRTLPGLLELWRVSAWATRPAARNGGISAPSSKQFTVSHTAIEGSI